MENEMELRTFLIESKKECYASGRAGTAGPRPGVVDLTHSRGPWMYLDSYYGGKAFLGEELVWCEGRAVWGMNYHGFMETEEIPEGFSLFLKAALLEVRPDAPYRGPSHFSSGASTAALSSSGKPGSRS